MVIPYLVDVFDHCVAAGVPLAVVHGAAPGVDSIADAWAWRLKRLHGPAVVDVFAHPADWERYGRAAGPIRNGEMVRLGAHLCLAFPSPASRGTWDCVRQATAAGIPVQTHPVTPGGTR